MPRPGHGDLRVDSAGHAATPQTTRSRIGAASMSVTRNGAQDSSHRSSRGHEARGQRQRMVLVRPAGTAGDIDKCRMTVSRVTSLVKGGAVHTGV